ncbi:hypothetical protein BN9982_740012 [Mycobacterium tuberculosis]|nr:hypothetical protein BN9982_740012 [Mycobacterium tuberculosis]
MSPLRYDRYRAGLLATQGRGQDADW